MARTKNRAAPPVAIKSPDPFPVSKPVARWNLTASVVGFGVILVALAAVAVVGMRVSWVPLRDTADTIGLHEVRQFYPLVIDLLDGLAVVASIALYGTTGYRWAIGTVMGLTAISLTLNVAHGSAAARITAASDTATWGHVILASAAPTICIGLGTHLASLTWGRVATAWQALRGTATPPVAPGVAAVAERPAAWVGAAPPGARLLDAWPLCCVAATPPVALVADLRARRGETMTTREVAEFCNVSTDTVRSWKQRGKLTPIDTGSDERGLVFAAADVVKLPGES